MPPNRRKRRSRANLEPVQRTRNAGISRRRPAEIGKLDDSSVGISDLPAEIRYMIYGFAMSPSDGGAVQLTGRLASAKDMALNLLATCRAVNKEAAGVFYGTTEFRIDIFDIPDGGRDKMSR